MRSLAIALFLAGTTPTLVGAQGGRWEGQVRAQLQRAVAALRGGGGSAGSSRGRGAVLMRTGTLNGDEGQSFDITLQSGVQYTVIGVCDDDCSNLHLVLGNAAGNEVAAERSSENLPVLRVIPRETLRYRVKVVMAGCRMNPCWYGVAVYE